MTNLGLQASLTPQYLAVDLDLALLTITDPSFWCQKDGTSSVPPLTYGGNFDIILDHLSRVPQLFTTVHAPCDVLYFVPSPIGLSDADWGVRSDAVS